MYKVIVAEDDLIQLKRLSNINYSAMGMELIGSFDNGYDALICHKKNNADIIITDIEMPGINGLEFLQKARVISKTTRFIIVSAYKSFDYAHKAIELGVEKYMIKPFTKNMIVNQLTMLKERLDEENEMVRKNDAISEVSSAEDRLTGIIKLKLINLDDNRKVCIVAANYQCENLNTDYFLSFLSPIVAFDFDNIVYGVIIDADIDTIKKSIKAEFVKHNNKIWFAVSDMTTIKSLKFAINSIKQTLNYQFINNIPICLYNQYKYKIITPYYQYSINKKLVIENIENEDRESLYINFEKIKNNIQKHNQTKDNIIREYTELLKDIILKFNYTNPSNNVLPVFLSFSQLNEWFFKFCLNMINSVSNSRKYTPSVKKTISYIRNNYTDTDLSLKTISDELICGYTTLTNEFRVQTGKTFREYLAQYRIEKSKLLLKETQLKIYEISDAVGLYRKNYNRLFIKITGQTPSDYRDDNT